MEHMDTHNDGEHIIDISINDITSSSLSHDGRHSEVDLTQHEDRLFSTVQNPTRQTSSSSYRINFSNPTFTTRGGSHGRQRRSPLNSVLWISLESLVTVGQIIASVVVLSMSTDESSEAPLFAWVVGYATGCVAKIPILYWRFCNRNLNTQQDSMQSIQGSSDSNPHDSTSYTAISDGQASDEENFHSIEAAMGNHQISGSLSARLNGLMAHFKTALDCFFAVWFVVGNVWIFGGHSTPTDAPKLYKLCIVFLTFSCIGYAMPFILCATICCCFPCIISLLGFRADFSQARGASAESISALPTYQFKSKNIGNTADHNSSGAVEGGVLGMGTERERVISGEDAVCCICLNMYVDKDELRELPCSHVFHVDCVDKWLKINASCPLCKSEIEESSGP